MLAEKLTNKLKKEGRTFRWFIKVYLQDNKYNQIMSQINDYVPLHDSTKEAIKKYLAE